MKGTTHDTHLGKNLLKCRPNGSFKVDCHFLNGRLAWNVLNYFSDDCSVVLFLLPGHRGNQRYLFGVIFAPDERIECDTTLNRVVPCDCSHNFATTSLKFCIEVQVANSVMISSELGYAVGNM